MFEAQRLGESRAGKPANSPVRAISRRRGLTPPAVFYFLSRDFPTIHGCRREHGHNFARNMSTRYLKSARDRFDEGPFFAKDQALVSRHSKVLARFSVGFELRAIAFIR